MSTIGNQKEMARHDLARAFSAILARARASQDKTRVDAPKPAAQGMTFFALPGLSGNPHPIVVRNSCNVLAANDSTH